MNDGLIDKRSRFHNESARVAFNASLLHVSASSQHVVNRQVLHFCSESYPPPYALIDHVFNRRLVEQGYRVAWIMPSLEVDRIERTTWRDNPVWLIPKIKPAGIVSLFTDYARHLTAIRQAVGAALEVVGPIDLVQVRDDPLMAHVAYRVAKEQNIPFVYQLSHLKEEELVLLAKTGLKGSRLMNFVKGHAGRVIRNRILRKADIVLPISPRMSSKLVGFGVHPDRLKVLPEGVDLAAFGKTDTMKLDSLRHHYDLHGKRVICYVGTMARIRRLDVLVRGFAKSVAATEGARLLMVGDGEPGDVEFLQHVAADCRMSQNVMFTGRVPLAEIPQFLQLAEIGVSAIPNNPIYENSSPIKILEYMASGIPVIASDIPPQREMIAESSCGVCVSHEENDYAIAIDHLYFASQHQRQQMGNNGHKFVAQHRDFSSLAAVMQKIYAAIVEK